MTPPALILSGPGAPAVAVRALGVGSVVLDLGVPLAPGVVLAAELRHGRPLPLRLRVRTSQPLAPGAWRATLEPVGSFDELLHARRGLCDALGSRVLDGDDSLGWLVPEPGGPWACHGPETGKVALLVRSGPQVVVRRRSDPDQLVATTTFVDALVLAFDAEGSRPRCEPPSPLAAGLAEPPAPPPPPPPPPTPEELSILGSQTLVVRPGPTEAELLGARTLVVKPAAAQSEAEVLGARTLIVRPGAEKAGKAAPGALRAQDIVSADMLAQLDAALGDD